MNTTVEPKEVVCLDAVRVIRTETCGCKTVFTVTWNANANDYDAVWVDEMHTCYSGPFTCVFMNPAVLVRSELFEWARKCARTYIHDCCIDLIKSKTVATS